MKDTPFTKESDGSLSWIEQPGDTYLVTGVDRSGRRFRRTCATWFYASGVNLWRGTRWLLRGGRRFRINTTIN